jgi:hypothetical protein
MPSAPGAPATARGGLRGALRRPSVLLPLALVVIIVATLVAPQQSSFDRIGALTTYSASSSGARGLYETLGRLGWRTERRKTPLTATLDTSAVYLVLDPPIPLTRREGRVLLDAVRRGAGLVFIVGNAGGIDDSLHLSRTPGGSTVMDRTNRAECPRNDTPIFPMWFDDSVHLYHLVTTGPLPTPDTVAFVHVCPAQSAFTVRADSIVAARREDAAASPPGIAGLGIPLGRGRIVALSDPDMLRNDVIRVCHWGMGLADIGMLDWVSRGGRPTLVFDEYHQGYGKSSSVLDATWAFLTRTSEGRLLAQALIAALILLVVLGVRPIAPRAPRSIERRSPLEHVDALAQAYEAVGATRVATRRLVRGLRRRHEHGAWLASAAAEQTGATVDDRFLSAVAARYRGVAPDVARVIGAEQQHVSAAELLVVAHAVDRIDRALDRPAPTELPLQPTSTPP